MYPSVRNTYQNGTIINGSKIDQNFEDIINALSDGTKALKHNLSTMNNLKISNSLISRTSMKIEGDLTTNDSILHTTTGNTFRTSNISLDVENLEINTSGEITPISSSFEIDSVIYQIASFASGIEIQTGVNDKLDVVENSITYEITLDPGTYIPTALATEIETKLNATLVQLWSCTYSATTTKFTITCESSSSILWRTGTNSDTSVGKNIGIDVVNNSTGTNFVSDYTYQIEYTDDLVTITATNFSEGDIVIIKKIEDSTSKEITIKNGTGNIVCGSDRVLEDNSFISLILIGTSWKMLNYAKN